MIKKIFHLTALENFNCHTSFALQDSKVVNHSSHIQKNFSRSFWRSSLTFVVLAGVLGLIAIGSIKADTFVVDTSIVGSDYTTVHFNSNGNDFQGMLFVRGETILTTGETITLDGGQAKVCSGQIFGYYVNSQRGNRVRPLDQSSLNVLQSGNSSYSGLSISGGLFTRCEGSATGQVFGQIIHTYKATTYKLVAGISASSYANNCLYSDVLNHYMLRYYIWDNYGGNGLLVNSKLYYQGATSFTGNVVAGNTVTMSSPNTYVYSSGSTDFLLISGSQFVVSGSDWNGIMVPPTPAIGTGIAVAGETGLLAGPILFSIQAGATGTSLIASGGGSFVIDIAVPNGVTGKVLFIYRSQDGNTWTGNTPDNTCTLNANKHCIFKTNHLSFFAGVGSACTGAPSNSSYIDPVSCTWSCNGSYTLSGSACVYTTSVGGGSYRLVKDDCKYSAIKKNLPGANDLGKDYSRSYYDRDCGAPSDEKIKIDAISNIRLGNSSFSEELNDAYVYAYSKSITTQTSIQAANPNAVLRRSELAKMISEYAIKVVGLEPTSKKACANFRDIKTQTAEIKFYIKTACELGLMGLASNGTTVNSKFNPSQYVSRAQFGTIFSRMLWGDKYNATLPYYYSSHLAALKTRGVMKQPNPKVNERKGRVMLMMMRADNDQIGKSFHAAADSSIDYSVPLFDQQ